METWTKKNEYICKIATNPLLQHNCCTPSETIDNFSKIHSLQLTGRRSQQEGRLGKIREIRVKKLETARRMSDKNHPTLKEEFMVSNIHKT